MKKSTCREHTRQAIRDGILQVPDACQICGVTKEQLQRERGDIASEVKILFGMEVQPRKIFFIAHHWRGYDYPLDVWFICHICNYVLSGKHDGSVTLEQARELARAHGGHRRYMSH